MTHDVATSDFTSIKQRLYDYSKYKAVKTSIEKTVAKRVQQQKQLKHELKLSKLPEAPLMPFDGSSHTDIHFVLPFTREDYFELVDTTGRVIREGRSKASCLPQHTVPPVHNKNGYIPNHTQPILQRVDIQSHKWIEQIQHFDMTYGCCAGSPDNIPVAFDF